MTALVIASYSSASARAAVIFTSAPDHAALVQTFSPSGDLALHKLALDIPQVSAHSAHAVRSARASAKR